MLSVLNQAPDGIHSIDTVGTTGQSLVKVLSAKPEKTTL